MQKIVLENFYLSFLDKLVLKNINFAVKENSVLAILGTSGSGKSKLLRSINRMNDNQFKSKGFILLDNKNIYDKKSDVIKLRRRIGMVSQKPVPFNMSIYNNISYGLKIHKFDKKNHNEIIKNSLISAGLYDEVKNRLNDNAYNLSGGQQQRLCIARALAINPEVLLMDEPSSALDPIAAKKIENLILELKKKYTILLVTHSIKQALKVSDEIIFLDAGEILKIGNTKTFFDYNTNTVINEYYSSH